MGRQPPSGIDGGKVRRRDDGRRDDGRRGDGRRGDAVDGGRIGNRDQFPVSVAAAAHFAIPTAR
jgi:hypothetical protein